MNSETAHEVCLNVRDPLDVRRRIHFTSRSIRMISMLFNGKEIDVIDLHSVLLRIAYMKGSFCTKRHITLSDVLIYVLTTHLLTIDDVMEVVNSFNEDLDSKHGEVRDMKRIMNSVSIQ